MTWIALFHLPLILRVLNNQVLSLHLWSFLQIFWMSMRRRCKPLVESAQFHFWLVCSHLKFTSVVELFRSPNYASRIRRRIARYFQEKMQTACGIASKCDV